MTTHIVPILQLASSRSFTSADPGSSEPSALMSRSGIIGPLRDFAFQAESVMVYVKAGVQLLVRSMNSALGQACHRFCQAHKTVPLPLQANSRLAILISAQQAFRLDAFKRDLPLARSDLCNPKRACLTRTLGGAA